MYEIFDHTADLGLRIRASSLEELFSEAGKGLLAVLLANPEAVRPVAAVELHVPAAEPEHLLVDWLGELLFAFEARQLLLCQFDVRLGPEGLTATARGEPVERRRHELDHEVKAVTYHALKVEQTPQGWLAEVVLDI